MATHNELKELSLQRLEDARTLLSASRYDAAAYMCGYALELALKACVCRRLRVSEYPEKQLKGALKTHDFDDLALLAGLSNEIDSPSEPQLFANWSTAVGWKPEWRYRPVGSVSETHARAMMTALEEKPYGVLPWLKRRW